MKIIGQSFLDPSEKFFHGLHVSAQGNPYLDGADSLLSFIGPIGTVMIIVLLVAALLVGSYLIMSKRMPLKTGALPSTEST